MGIINENIAKNIAKLRKANGMKQLELAEKLNYSDKAISKWERGDSVPDIEMLYEIAKLFNVSVDYLTQEHSDSEINETKRSTKMFIRNLLITIMLCVSVFLISTVIFVYATVKDPTAASKYWVAFVAATPFCSLIIDFYGKRERYWLVQLISLSLFVWTAITTSFCFTIIFEIKYFWMLYLVGVPVQAAICLHFFWKKTF